MQAESRETDEITHCLVTYTALYMRDRCAYDSCQVTGPSESPAERSVSASDTGVQVGSKHVGGDRSAVYTTRDRGLSTHRPFVNTREDVEVGYVGAHSHGDTGGRSERRFQEAIQEPGIWDKGD